MINLKNLDKQGFKYVCGVDEAGRGPLAGPLSLSFFVVSIEEYKKVLNPLLKLGLNDSKKLKEEKREELFNLIRHSCVERKPDLKKIKHGSQTKSGMTFGFASYFNAMISAEKIDKYGISISYQKLIKNLLKKVATSDVATQKTYFLLDGSIKFPEEISHEVIIHGDSIEPVIMAASVVSKVKRDRYMKRISKKFPEYNFDVHKGYGTLNHRKAIQKFGLSSEHRKSFCKNLIK